MSIAQTIKKMALESMKASSPLQFIEGEVQSSPPNVQLRLKNNPKLIIPADFIIVPEHLTRHTRTAMIDGSHVNVSFTDGLKAGDKVMVAAVQGGQSFFIIDRV